MKTNTAEELDLRGLKCPLPALFVRRALGRIPAGAQLSVLADDPLASVDIPHMCWQEGYEVVTCVCGAESTTTLTLRRPQHPGSQEGTGGCESTADPSHSPRSR